MRSRRIAGTFGCVVAVVIAVGCGNQPARVLLPESASDRVLAPDALARVSLRGELPGPRICFFNSFLDYCYPTPGYCPCPETEVVVPVRAGAGVSMSWSAEPSAGRTIRSYRWAVDIEDVTDETPRIDENTDFTHWSIRSRDAVAVALGPWSDGEQHRLYLDVEDSMGWRSLGIVRFVAGTEVNHSPDCAGALAELARIWPPNRQLVPVTIAGVIDPDGDPVTITVTSVTQDEPVQDAGNGATCPDAVIDDGAAQVRVERSGAGNGRVYSLAFTATDDRGASCTGSADVCIPSGGGPNQACIKDDRVANSLGPCTPRLAGRR